MTIGTTEANNMNNNSESSDLPPSDLVQQYFNTGFSLLRLNGKAPIERGWPMKPGLSIEQAIIHLDHRHEDGNTKWWHLCH